MVCSRERDDRKDDVFSSLFKILKHPKYHQYDYVSIVPTKYFLRLTKILIVSRHCTALVAGAVRVAISRASGTAFAWAGQQRLAVPVTIGVF